MWTTLSTQCTIIYSINKIKGQIQRALKGQGKDLKLWNYTNKTLSEMLSNHVFFLSKQKHEMINKQRNSGSVMVICPSCLWQCFKHTAIQCALFVCFHFCFFSLGMESCSNSFYFYGQLWSLWVQACGNRDWCIYSNSFVHGHSYIIRNRLVRTAAIKSRLLVCLCLDFCRKK